MNQAIRSIEVCFSPELFPLFKNESSIVVIVDILRATSAICTAFANGAEKIIPVSTLDEAREYKKRGFIVAAERDGYVLDFADFGNSPFNFSREKAGGKTIVYSTTNGTQAINLAKDHYQILVGSFLNLDALCKWIAKENRNVIVLCAGWKNKFSLEDTLSAGAIVDNLISEAGYSTVCDSALAARDLWRVAKKDLVSYIQKAAQRERLRQKGLDDVIEYCLTLNLLKVVPAFIDGALTDLVRNRQITTMVGV
ncbi:MAG: 2-phosphosulfolactate phosphatase [Bacteroidota bacterium]|nr:2-phosphosulfolactate phosphatase [Bacteroidota bacterium]